VTQSATRPPAASPSGSGIPGKAAPGRAASASAPAARGAAIGRSARIMLAAFGLVSWAGGGAATFLGKGNAGATALVIVGAGCLALALMGRWPSRVAISGNEVSWDEVRETIESQIESADGGSAELEILLDRLITLQRTGMVPDPPAEVYDQGVTAAIRRLLPGAEVVKLRQGNKGVPDFIVRYRGGELYLETKWRNDPADDFRGRTLPPILGWVAGTGRLLVVVNAVEEHVTAQARDLVHEALGDAGQVVGWLDARDDAALGRALAALLPMCDDEEPVGPPLTQPIPVSISDSDAF
jgi:hypothetical protein